MNPENKDCLTCAYEPEWDVWFGPECRYPFIPMAVSFRRRKITHNKKSNRCFCIENGRRYLIVFCPAWAPKQKPKRLRKKGVAA